MSIKLKEFWREHDQTILTVAALVLVAVVSFRAGETHQKSREMAEIKVNLSQNVASNPHEEKVMALGEAMERKGTADNSQQPSGTPSASPDTENQNKNCVLVGSKNSNKYHQPSCKMAAKISAENRVCFSSADDAKSKGYEPAKCCHK